MDRHSLKNMETQSRPREPMQIKETLKRFENKNIFHCFKSKVLEHTFLTMLERVAATVVLHAWPHYCSNKRLKATASNA
jgi:hypothetical protein